MKLEDVRYSIPTDILTATIEAMRDLKAYYENDACALARINGKQASELAQARLESAEVATGLYGFYGAQRCLGFAAGAFCLVQDVGSILYCIRLRCW